MVSHILLIVVAFAVFLTQIVLSRLSDSLLTLVDSAHTLSLIVALCPTIILSHSSSLSSHAQARLPTLFSFLSPLLLSSLCLALTLGSLGHLVHPHHSHQPTLIFVAGVLGLLFNVTYLAVTGALQGKEMEAGTMGPKPPVYTLAVCHVFPEAQKCSMIRFPFYSMGPIHMI